MRVLLLNNGGFSGAEGVKFPVEVKALRLTNGSLFKISKYELHRVGFVNFDDLNEWSFADGKEAVLVTPTEKTDTPCIRGMCCNQFGERDEIQAIIDKLHADVAERDERIKALGNKCGELYKLAEELGACSEFLKVNFACSWGDHAQL